ncbi:mannonate dehydratase [Pseudochrobactrum saccharolyticum]|uniref:mannonate dehydratase n=1 Tax=Pseudochrobactrum saccharolyticum TaxID=354352 RepID=UPI002756573B|nr:mannonate dehydratase [Pseudochrobactrum saccharolyticum]MDP8251768.1 mannonate dehydratase [Pseudochrobactrum saccharolyticum]
MRQAWRWFGPDAGVPLDAVRQAGATDIVSALHDVPIGQAWTSGQIAERKTLIENTPADRTPLVWSVVESIPISDAIKREGGAAKQDIAAWIASMEALAAHDIKVICYNFMPVVDWCRTDLDYVTPSGATAMRFDQDRFAAFDLHILQRKNAEQDYSEADRLAARATYEAMSEAEINQLIFNIASALPGSTTEPLTIPAFRDKLETYAHVDANKLRQNLIAFLEEVTPVADELGVRLTLHPDDPPRSLFGLPRIASNEADYAAIFDAVPSPANGMCFCSGSLGVRADNDLPAMARRFASRIYFSHLRATTRQGDGRSFYEAAHLEGDVDMVALLRALVEEDRKRDSGSKIIFRSDHGHRMLDDLAKQVTPGYPVIGRLRGLAELRGVITALDAGALCPAKAGG